MMEQTQKLELRPGEKYPITGMRADSPLDAIWDAARFDNSIVFLIGLEDSQDGRKDAGDAIPLIAERILAVSKENIKPGELRIRGELQKEPGAKKGRTFHALCHVHQTIRGYLEVF